MAISLPPDQISGNATRDSLAGTTVLFDADCGVCREAVRQLRRWDRESRIEFVSFDAATASGDPALVRLAAERQPAEALHVVDAARGEVVSGGLAALAILDALPGGWLFRPWAGLPTTTIAADVVCRVAGRHRDRLAWLVGFRDEVTCPMSWTQEVGGVLGEASVSAGHSDVSIEPAGDPSQRVVGRPAGR